MPNPPYPSGPVIPTTPILERLTHSVWIELLLLLVIARKVAGVHSLSSSSPTAPAKRPCVSVNLKSISAAFG